MSVTVRFCGAARTVTGSSYLFQTATGRSSAGEATALVLLLPFLIFCFGMAVAAIAMIVS